QSHDPGRLWRHGRDRRPGARRRAWPSGPKPGAHIGPIRRGRSGFGRRAGGYVRRASPRGPVLGSAGRGRPGPGCGHASDAPYGARARGHLVPLHVALRARIGADHRLAGVVADGAGRTRGEHARHRRRGRRPGEVRKLDFMPWGGAYNRVPADTTAFPHREELFLLEHSVVVPAGFDAASSEAARAWLSDSWELVHASGSGGVYGNFPDTDLPDEHRAYWGANLERVRRVKEEYDPERVFG